MKKTKTTTAQTTARTWNKEDYYEYMDVALDAHNAEKHASVKHYANSRRKVDAEDEAHAQSSIAATLRVLFAPAPARTAPHRVAVHKIR